MNQHHNTRKRYMGTRQVRFRYGGKSQRTIDRWIVNPDLHFPKPCIINGRRFWDEADLAAWERERAVGAAS
jgi:predicted DNA-binding transcriptional regulator AlpA